MSIYINTPLFVAQVAGKPHLKLMRNLTDGFEIIPSLDEAKVQAHAESLAKHQYRYVVPVWDESVRGYVVLSTSDCDAYFSRWIDEVVYKVSP